jgi:predicted helicase
LDARTYDGFRKVVAEEFNHIYIIDLKGDARTNSEQRRREGGNVFSNQIRVGVAVYFLVRKHGDKGCRIHYNAVPDYAHATEKKAYLRDNTFEELKFESLHPDKNHNWLNLSENDWDEFIPVASKEAKLGKTPAEQQTIFKLFSLGVVTNRDEWVYDYSAERLANKVEFFISFYNHQVSLVRDKSTPDLDETIKWTRSVKNDLGKRREYAFNETQIIDSMYRPFVKKKLYFSKDLNEMQYQLPHIFTAAGNIAIGINDRGARAPFASLAVDAMPELHFVSSSDGFQCLPLYRYTADGERVDNITDWALGQFQKQFRDKVISKEDIFHYVYAVLHHPAYRAKYEINLKRELPRIPFYVDFWQWAGWGKQLMDLHLNYEQVEPYPLKRLDKDLEDHKPKPRLIAREPSGLIEVDTQTTLSGIPPEAWQYRLGTYSALGWILERHKERKPKDPTIREKFNTYRFADYKEQVIDLLRRVCTVSVETMKIIGQMPPDVL